MKTIFSHAQELCTHMSCMHTDCTHMDCTYMNSVTVNILERWIRESAKCLRHQVQGHRPLASTFVELCCGSPSTLFVSLHPLLCLDVKVGWPSRKAWTEDSEGQEVGLGSGPPWGPCQASSASLDSRAAHWRGTRMCSQ